MRTEESDISAWVCAIAQKQICPKTYSYPKQASSTPEYDLISGRVSYHRSKLTRALNVAQLPEEIYPKLTDREAALSQNLTIPEATIPLNLSKDRSRPILANPPKADHPDSLKIGRHNSYILARCSSYHAASLKIVKHSHLAPYPKPNHTKPSDI